MRKLLIVSTALASLTAPAFAADVAVKAPRTGVLPPFAWTGCFLGAHVGAGWGRKDIADPVALVEENAFSTPATTVTTTRVDPSGAVIGGSLGAIINSPPTGWSVSKVLPREPL